MSPLLSHVTQWGFMQTLGGLRPTAGHATTMIWVCVFALGKDALSVLTHRANALTAAAVVVVPVREAGIEVQFVGVVLAVRRRRPIVAVRTNAAELAKPAPARSGQEDAIAIDLAGELPTVHAVKCRPFGSAVVK